MSENIDLTPIIGEFEDFFSVNYKKQINELVTNYPTKKSLMVDFADLARYDPELADALLKNPDDYIKAAESALSQMNLFCSIRIE